MEKEIDLADILKRYVAYGEKNYFESITTEKVFKDLGISKEKAQEISNSVEYKTLKESIESLKTIYSGIERRCKEDKIKNGFNDFVNFYRWYKNQSQKQINGEKICHYCGTTESNLKRLFKINDDDKNKPLYSKKPSFTATLQVDRKNSNGGYNGDNCVLACSFCNNAKSDMVKCKDLEFFEEHFKAFVQKFYTHLDSTIKYLD